MPSQEDVEDQQELLAINRRNLHLYLKQRDQQGGLHTTAVVVNSIIEARTNIKRIKSTLRAWSIRVDDLPDDDEVVSAPYMPAVSATAHTVNTTPQTPKRFNIKEAIVVAATIIACVAAVIVVPEVRSILGLDKPNTPTAGAITDTSSSSGAPSQPATNISLPTSQSLAVVPTNAALAPTILPTAPTVVPTSPSAVDATAIPPQATANSEIGNSTSESKIAVDQSVVIKPNDFLVKIISVETLSTGTMRWNFEFQNNAQEIRRVIINPQISYISDDLGKRYSMTSPLFDEKYEPGIRVERNIEFEAPQQGANILTLHVLVNYFSVVFPNPTFRLSISTDPAASTAPTSVPDNVRFIEVNQPIKSSIDNFNTVLRSAEVLPTGTIRWNFDFWNKTAETRRIIINPKISYIVDDQGKRYAMVSDKLDIRFEAGIRGEYSIEFESPAPDAKTLILHMMVDYFSVVYPQPTFRLQL
jgi:hypothetical protein